MRKFTNKDPLQLTNIIYDYESENLTVTMDSTDDRYNRKKVLVQKPPTAAHELCGQIETYGITW